MADGLVRFKLRGWQKTRMGHRFTITDFMEHEPIDSLVKNMHHIDADLLDEVVDDVTTVRIDRKTRWGNPFTVEQFAKSRVLKHDKDGQREAAVMAFERFFVTSPAAGAVWMRENIWRLRGAHLCCWCVPKLCHGHVLATYAAETIGQDVWPQGFWYTPWTE